MQKPKPQLRPVPKPSRKGKVLVAGHFPVEVSTQLRIMAAEERSTVQALIAEALDLLFAKRRKPQIARQSQERSRQ